MTWYQLDMWIKPLCFSPISTASMAFYTAAKHAHWLQCLTIDFKSYVISVQLTQWGRVTHICVVKLTIIGSDNGLSPGRRQAMIWTNARILLIGPLGTNFIEILIRIQTFSFNKVLLKMSSAIWGPCGLGLNVLAIFYEYINISRRLILTWLLGMH